MNVPAQNRLAVRLLQAVYLQLRMADRIVLFHKPEPEKPLALIIGYLQMASDVLRLHLLIFRKIVEIGLHFQIMLLILFL